MSAVKKAELARLERAARAMRGAIESRRAGVRWVVELLVGRAVRPPDDRPDDTDQDAGPDVDDPTGARAFFASVAVDLADAYRAAPATPGHVEWDSGSWGPPDFVPDPARLEAAIDRWVARFGIPYRVPRGIGGAGGIIDIAEGGGGLEAPEVAMLVFLGAYRDDPEMEELVRDWVSAQGEVIDGPAG